VVDSFEVETEMTLGAMPGLLLEMGGKGGGGGGEFPFYGIQTRSGMTNLAIPLKIISEPCFGSIFSITADAMRHRRKDSALASHALATVANW
jgi:hypothetical protein